MWAEPLYMPEYATSCASLCYTTCLRHLHSFLLYAQEGLERVNPLVSAKSQKCRKTAVQRVGCCTSSHPALCASGAVTPGHSSITCPGLVILMPKQADSSRNGSGCLLGMACNSPSYALPAGLLGYTCIPYIGPRSQPELALCGPNHSIYMPEYATTSASLCYTTCLRHLHSFLRI